MDGQPEVIEAIHAVLAKKGSISVEELMELALYQPRGGLYWRTCPSIGAGGHFTTCARIDAGLGEAVGRWLAERWKEDLGKPLRWHVIEVGGGDGSLAEAVISSLPLRLRLMLTFHVVERSHAALELQLTRLGRRTVHHESLADALASCDGSALIFSNELVDAFPARLLERRDKQWNEIRLVDADGLLRESLHPAPWLSEAYSIAELHRVPSRGRAEAHRSYRKWLTEWTPAWKGGSMLTIDYGDECDALYGRGGRGTMRAYFSNIRVEDDDLYRRLGLQDLTCDVNVTDLKRWGVELGLENVEQWSQRSFLEKYLGRKRLQHSPSAEFIAKEGGAGTHFFVLWQRRKQDEV